AVGSNGNLQFAGSNSAFANACLPAVGFSYTVFPYWDDLRTDPTGSGIFVSTSGSAPNRTFNIEWRATYYQTPGTTANFEVRLYDSQPTRSEFVYGHKDPRSATVGVQKDQPRLNQ